MKKVPQNVALRANVSVVFGYKFEKENALVVEAAEALIEYLKIDVPVRVDVVHQFSLPFMGHCDSGNYNPIIITVNIAHINTFWDFLVTLSHEFVHAQQYASLRAVDFMYEDKYHLIWNGKPILVDFDGPGYDNAPWEVEAYKQEEKIAKALNKMLDTL